MIEIIINIALVAAGMVVFYFVGKQNGREEVISEMLVDDTDDFLYDFDEEEVCDYDEGYKDGYSMGFQNAKDIADIEFAELVAATQAVATPKKVAKKTTKKKGK